MPTFLERLRRDPARVRQRRLERLQALSEELSAAQTRDEVRRVTFEHALAVVEAGGAALYRERAPGELELVHAVGIGEEFLDRFRRVLPDDPAPVAEAYRSGRPVWVASREELRERFPGLLDPDRSGANHAWAAFPLGGAVTRGAAVLAFGEPRAFDEEERSFVLAAGRLCSCAAERARLFEASNRHADRLRQILSVATALSSAATPREVAAGALRALGILGACAAEIHGFDGERVALLARQGRRSEGDPAPVPVDAPTPAAEVIRTGRAIWLETSDEIAQRYPLLDRGRARSEERAWAVVPLLASGHTLGALVATFAEERRLEPDDRTYLRLVAQPCAQALERARLFGDALRARAEVDHAAALVAGACAGAPVPIAVLDRELRFLSVNEAFVAANGVSADDHLGRTPLDLLPAAAREPLLAAFHGVLATGSPVDLALPAKAEASVEDLSSATMFPVRFRGELAAVGLLLRPGACRPAPSSEAGRGP